MTSVITATEGRARLRVLVAARDTEIFRLALAALARDYDLEHECVDSVEALHRALADKEWDLLLCDPAPAGSSCREILASLREKGNDLLVIAVSEEEDEKLIRELLSAGVRAALGPARLGRLSPIVARELEDVRERRLRELRMVLESSPDPMLVVRGDGRILHVNRLLEGLLGYAEAELAGQPVELLVPQAIRTRHVGDRERYTAAPHARPMGIGVELAARHTDGTEIPVEISLGPVRLGGEALVCCGLRDLRERRRAERLLRAIVEGTSGDTGEAFLRALVKNLALALGVRYAFVGEFIEPQRDRARVLAFWNGEDYSDPFEYSLAGTPCSVVGADSECLVPDHVQQAFPEDADLVRAGAECYFGLRLHSSTGLPFGLLTIMDVKPLADEASARTVLRIFAARASAELERIGATAALAMREERFRRLTTLAVDWYWEQDEEFRFALIEGPEDTPIPGFKSSIGKRRWELEGFELTPEQWAEHRKLLEGHHAFHDLEFPVRDAKGTQRWIAVSGEPLFNDSGAFRGYRGTSKEITARKRAEEALRASEKRFRATFEQAAVGIAHVAPDGRWLRVNRKLCDIVGYTREELLASTFQDITHPEDLDADLAYVKQVLAGEIDTYSVEKRYLRKDRSIVRINLTVALVRDEAGRPDYFISVIEDIDQRKQAEEALRETAARLSLVADNVPAMIAYTDAVFRFRYANRQFLEFYAGKESVAEGRHMAEVLGAATFASVRPGIERALEGETVRYDATRRRHDGKLRHIDVTLVPHREDAGRVLGVYTFVLDVTESRRAEEELREREAQHRLVLDNAPAMISYFGTDYRYRYANLRYREFFTGSVAPIDGKTLGDILGEQLWQVVRPQVDQALAGETLNYARNLRRHDGSMRELDVSLVPHRDESGEVHGVYSLLLDVSKRRRAEREIERQRKLLRDVIDAIPAMIFLRDAEARYVLCNRTLAEFFGKSVEWIIGKRNDDFIAHPDERVVPEQTDRELFETGKPVGPYEISHLREGRRHWFQYEKRLLTAHGDGRQLALGVGTDITRRKLDEQALRLHNRALEASVNSIMITQPTDEGQKIVYVNPAFERITGYSASEVMGQSPRFLHGDDRHQPGVEALRAASRSQREGMALLRNYRKDGTLFWNELRVAPVRDEEGSVTHFIGVASDVTERMRYEEEIERHANYDTLTGLPNRNLLNDRLAHALAKSDRSKLPVGVLYADLDNLKRINDSLGHEMGDQVIASLGARLAGTVRTGDTVARVGGDEFVIVLADLKRDNDAALVAQKLRECVAAPLAAGAHEFVMSASIGVALYPKDGADAATLLRHADTALYQAKEQGRDGFRFFAAEMNERVVRFMAIENDLRRALEAGEFWLQYQPIVRLATGETVGAEALIRWRRADGSVVSPAQFIPVAEESGLIVPIGRWVLETAARQAAEWNRGRRRRLFLSVNLSARQFRDPHLLDVVRGALDDAKVDPALIKLEITESAVMQDVEGTQRWLGALKDLGVTLSVDDFGTGYSSLAYLKRFPLDTLKIDRSFVRDLPGDRDDLAISRAVIDLGRGLGLEVVAEGVETREQAEVLAAHGCEFAQGYLFGRPVDPNEFAAPGRTGPATKRSARRGARRRR